MGQVELLNGPSDEASAPGLEAPRRKKVSSKPESMAISRHDVASVIPPFSPKSFVRAVVVCEIDTDTPVSPCRRREPSHSSPRPVR